MISTHKHELTKSARTKLAAAQALVKGKTPHPGPAAYLIHVTLECAIKVRILVSQNAERTDQLRNVRGMDEATFDGLFKGRSGHDLHHLARVARLRSLLVAKDREELLMSDAWRAMAGDRPYSLRYGTVVISDSEAEDHLKLAKELTSLILHEAA
jgi:hypothetical protein